MWQERYPQPTPAQLARKSASRLKKLAPLRYRLLVRRGVLPAVGKEGRK